MFSPLCIKGSHQANVVFVFSMSIVKTIFARLVEIPTMTLQDIKETKCYGRTCVPFRITKGNIFNRIGPWPLLMY